MTAAISEDSRAELRGISSRPNSKPRRVRAMGSLGFALLLMLPPLLGSISMMVTVFTYVTGDLGARAFWSTLSVIFVVLALSGLFWALLSTTKPRRLELAVISEAAEARYGVSIKSLDQITAQPFVLEPFSTEPVSPEEWNQANRRRIVELYGEQDASKLLREFNGVSYSFIEDDRIADGVGYYLIQGDELYLYDEAGVELPWR